jgi:hypothetical protein
MAAADGAPDGMLVSTLAGLHALRIDPNGSVRPWPVAMN